MSVKNYGLKLNSLFGRDTAKKNTSERLKKDLRGYCNWPQNVGVINSAYKLKKIQTWVTSGTDKKVKDHHQWVILQLC